MAFKMKGFTPFTKKADGWRPHHTAETEVSSIERKQKRLDKRASKGKDVSGAQERLDKRSERVYDREIARAERKERKAAKKLEKGKGKQAARKQYKADKIRETVSPLKKGPKKRKGKSDYDPKTKTRSSRWIYGEEGIIPDFFQGGKKKSRRVKVDPKSKTRHGSRYNFDGSPAATDNRGERWVDMPNAKEAYLRRVADWKKEQKKKKK